MGGGVPICFHPSTKPFFLSVCCYCRDELIRQSFAAIIKARMEVQQLSVMLHLLNASSPPRTIAPVHGRALTRRRCQRCALTGGFIRLGFIICLNCDPYIPALAPAPHVQINFALNAGGRNVAQNGFIWRVFIFQALIKWFHSGGLNKACGRWVRRCVLPQK